MGFLARRPKSLPPQERSRATPRNDAAAEHPPQTYRPWSPSLSRGGSVQTEFISNDSLVTPLPAHSLRHLQFLCSGGQVSSVPSLSNCEIIMVGDFNLNWMEKCHTAADSFAMDFHLTKLISQPTRLNLRVVIIHY